MMRFCLADVVDLQLTCTLIRTNFDFMHLTSNELDLSLSNTSLYSINLLHSHELKLHNVTVIACLLKRSHDLSRTSHCVRL